MAKAALGRGLRQLLEANGVAAPADGNPVEERPPIRLGAGVRTLLEPAEADRAGAIRTDRSTEPSQAASKFPEAQAVPAATPAPAPAAHLMIPLLIGDGLLCLLAFLLARDAIASGNTVVFALCVLALLTGAWLGCLGIITGSR